MVSAMLDIKKNEKRAVFATFFTLFGILAGHTILETARDAYFIGNLPVHHLPWVYLATACLAWVVILRDHGNPGRRGLVVWLWLSAAITLVFYMLTDSPQTWVFYALYVWSGFFISVSIGHFWLVLGRLFSLEQAKRLFSIIAVGSVLGAITGASFAAFLATTFGVREMLLAAAVCFAFTATGPLLIRGTGLHWETRHVGIKSLSAMRMVLNHPYMSRMAVLAIVSTITFTLVDYIFKAQVSVNVASEDLPTFFALFYTVLNLLGLLAQLLLTGAALQVLGVQRSLWILPVLLVACSSFLVVGLGLTAALALKGAEGSLKHTLHRTATEVLYVPVTEQLRPYAKRLIDIFGQRLAQAIGSLLILLVVAAGGDQTILSGIVILCGVVWILLARDLRPHYLELFRATLRRGTTATRVAMPRIDLEALEALMTSLNSGDNNEVLAALDILESSNRSRLIPALILHHPSQKVVLRALDVFTSAGREDFIPITKRLMDHHDPEIRAAVIRARPSDAIVRAGLKDKAPLVRGTALVGLVGRTDELGLEAQRLVKELVQKGDTPSRVALARAIEHQSVFEQLHEGLLLTLGEDPDPSVRSATARAMKTFPRPAFIHPLIGMLTYREARNPARDALAAIGPECAHALGEALSDDSVDFGIRVNIPFALSLWAERSVSDRLIDRLLVEDSGMIRFKILRALSQMHRDNPQLVFDSARLVESTQGTLRAAYLLLHWYWLLKDGAIQDASRVTPGHELFTTLIHDKYEHALDRLFRHLDLIHPDEDFARIKRGLWSKDSDDVASSLELLENLLLSPQREMVLGLVRPASERSAQRERLSHAPTDLELPEQSYEDLLMGILTSNSDSLRAVAAYHVGELGLLDFREVLLRLSFGEESPSQDVVRHALETLESRASEMGEAP
jgi:ATP:ADP antiporter, AAA family